VAIARASGQTPQVAGSAGATSIAVTLPQNVVAGNAIMAIGKYRNGTPGFSDGLGNTYAVDADTGTDGNNGVRIGSAKNLTTGGACTVTFGTVTSSRIGISAMEYSGFSGGAAFDKSASAGAAGTAVDSGATATTTAADELLIGGASDGAGSTYTWTNSFTLVAENTTGRFSMADRIVAAAAAYNATATLGTSTDWRAVIATYKETGGGAAAFIKMVGNNFRLAGLGGLAS